MSLRYRHLLTIGLLAVLFSAAGQQQATVSQYMFNGMAINPAYAGSHGALSASMLTRFQNVGLPGAPNTQTLSIHSPLVNQRIALGLMVINDKIGVIGQTGVTGVYAYKLPMNNQATLSFGLQAGISTYRAAYASLDIYQADPLFAQDVRQARPNFGAGIYYSKPMWYLGLSMPHMLNNVFQRSNTYATVYQNIPVLLTGGYVYKLNRLLKIKPNFLFKVVDNRAIELDLNANLLFDEVVWLGVSYKFNNAVNILLEMQVTDQFRVGYSYSITTGPIQKAESGSHELLLQYRFKFNMKGVVTPRYF